MTTVAPRSGALAGFLAVLGIGCAAARGQSETQVVYERPQQVLARLLDPRPADPTLVLTQDKPWIGFRELDGSPSRSWTLDGWLFRGELLWLQRDRWEGGPLVYRGADRITIDSLDAPTELGARFGVGRQFGLQKQWELTGWWVSDLARSRGLRGTFDVNIPVVNRPFSFDDFGRNVSFVDVDYETDVVGVEWVCRAWKPAWAWLPARLTTGGAEVAFEGGVRYLNLDETFSIYSQFSPMPAPSGFQDFDYIARADNHILAGLVGVTTAWHLGPTTQICGLVRTSSGIDLIETDVALRERTGNVAFDKERHETEWVYLVEFAFYGSWRPWRCLEVRGGYQGVLLTGYAGAPDQFSFNLAEAGDFDSDNSAFFHGPFVSVSLSW
jgi:hypothetical protein